MQKICKSQRFLFTTFNCPSDRTELNITCSEKQQSLIKFLSQSIFYPELNRNIQTIELARSKDKIYFELVEKIAEELTKKAEKMRKPRKRQTILCVQIKKRETKNAFKHSQKLLILN